MSKWIANQIPSELVTVANAGRCTAPCLFVQSQCDRVVPTKYQDMIIDSYRGEKRVFTIHGADHHELVGEDQQNDYFAALKWLGNQIGS